MSYKQPLEQKISLSLEKICQAYRTTMWELAYKYNLTLTQLEIIIHTYKFPKITPTKLALELGISKATLSESISALKKKGIIKTKQDTTDARRRILSLSPKGRQIYNKIQNSSFPIQNIISQLSSSEKRILFHTLRNIIETLQKQGYLPRVRICSSCQNLIYKNNKPFCKLTKRVISEENLIIDCPSFRQS